MVPNRLYVSRRMKKVFSEQYIERKPLGAIIKKILNINTEMEFYFLKPPPSSRVKNFLIERIKKSTRRGRRLIDFAQIRNEDLFYAMAHHISREDLNRG